MGIEEARPLAVAGRMLTVRPPDVPNPMQMAHDVETCMYHTGIDPFTKKPVTVARNLHDHMLQRALMQFFKPANYFAVREALMKAGRKDLIGNGCDALIPSDPPREALAARRKQANRDLTNADHYHAMPAKKRGYRPGRKSQTRRDR